VNEGALLVRLLLWLPLPAALGKVEEEVSATRLAERGVIGAPRLLVCLVEHCPIWARARDCRVICAKFGEGLCCWVEVVAAFKGAGVSKSARGEVQRTEQG